MRQCLYDKDGTWHYIGSRWRTSDCMNCYCQANGDMSCCQLFPALSTEVRGSDVFSSLCSQGMKTDRSTPCPIYRGKRK
uniref:Beta-microseminoprotein n=1 Tax=Oncorhynchus tshawytscha TaxID=74940 RepID=A0AAZ3P6K6_ONCTS